MVMVVVVVIVIFVVLVIFVVVVVVVVIFKALVVVITIPIPIAIPITPQQPGILHPNKSQHHPSLQPRSNQPIPPPLKLRIPLKTHSTLTFSYGELTK